MTSEQRPLLAASSGTFAADDNPLLGEVAVGSLPSTAEAGIRGARDAASASRLFATPADRLLVAVTNLGLAAFGWLVLTAATSDGLVLFSWHPIGQVVFISAVTNAV
ncbi:hypothetical protein HK105_204031 [Polyrhizophydium stewartii]|uniref:Uncharacterized protein n=1 Tax=Polyrhizophydium stewartii TaxID=2732419 RepID=A0ABR4N9S2_9FUNG